MKIAWTHYGPPRATSIEVPPKPSLIDWYVLGYDEKLERVFYLCRPDDDKRGAELHTFDGAAWHKETKKRAKVDEHLEGGGYDSVRGGVVGWSFEHDYDKNRVRAKGVLFGDGGSKALATRGDDPVVEPEGDDDVGTFDKHGMFAFDRGREVWVCATRRGVWELDASGAWSKKADAGPIPKDWHNETGQGIYDPVGKRAVFMVQGEEDRYAIRVLAWDGAKLERLSMKGLPKLTLGLFDPAVEIVGHPKHGLVLHAGAGKLFAATKTGWTPLAETSKPPPKMEKACLAYDPKRDLFVLGPGTHEGAGGSEFNEVFFVLRGREWEALGVPVVHSPIAQAAYGNSQLEHAGGAWYALGSHSLRTWRYDDGTWKEVTSKEVGEKVGGWEVLQLVAARDHLHAVMQTGAVFALDGARWDAIAKKDSAFKQRTSFALAADPHGRLMVWGGEAKGRKLNDTLFLENKRWRVVKKTSPQPADFKHGRKDDVYVGTSAVWDTSLDTFVRFGFEEVAVLLADETWKPYKPKGYKENVGPREWGHVPVHDAETGETLIVDFEGTSAWEKAASRPAQVLRFDLGGCTPLATIEYPKELAPQKQHDAAAFHAIAETFSYDPATRSLYAQVKEDSAGTYRLDLAPLFAKAKSLGARTMPKGGAPKAAPARFYRVKDGKPEIVTSERKGFVRAADLPHEALVGLVGVASRKIIVGKPIKKGPAPASRLGGSPSVPSAKWPRVRKQPMGFLFQIETGDLLKKHAGVAVFCALDGEATSTPGDNAVVLLDRAAFKKSHAAPEGVPALSARALQIDAPKFEIDEDRAERFGASDPDLGAAFERLQTSKGMQSPGLCDKVGGLGVFLQEVVPAKGHKLVAQLDFDSIDTSKEWPDAGLAGCVYVFVRDDEKSGLAFWQYT
jgi:hypothetical protein